MLKLKIHQSVLRDKTKDKDSSWRIIPVDLMYLVNPTELPIVDNMFNYYYFFPMSNLVANSITNIINKPNTHITSIPRYTRSKKLHANPDEQTITKLKNDIVSPDLIVIIPTLKLRKFYTIENIEHCYAKLSYLATRALRTYSINIQRTPLQVKLKTPGGILSDVCVLCAKYLESLNGTCHPYTADCIRHAELSWVESESKGTTQCHT